MKDKAVIAKVLVGGLFVCLFLFFVLKGCVVTTWESHEQPVTYSIHGADGREFTMVLLPNFETMILYKDPSQNFAEGILTKMRGSYGTHYIGPIWGLQGPRAGGLFGFRWLADGQEPVHMEIINLEKFTQGQGTSTFGDVGETFYTVIIKDKDRLQFQGMWLEKVNTDQYVVTALRERFKKTE